MWSERTKAWSWYHARSLGVGRRNIGHLGRASLGPHGGLRAAHRSLELGPARLRYPAAGPVCVTQPGAWSASPGRSPGAPAQGGPNPNQRRARCGAVSAVALSALWRCLEAPLHLLWRCWAGMSLASVSSILCRHLVRANVRVRVRSRLAATVTVTVGVTVKLGVGPRGWAGFLAPFVQAEPQPHAAALGVAQVRRTHEGRRLARWLTELPDGFVFVSRPGMGGLRPGCAA